MRSAKLRRPAVFWALAGAALLVAHDAVFLAQLGPGEPLVRALRGGGHAYWEAASLILVAIVVLAVLGVAVRLVSLRNRARTAHAARSVPLASTRRRLALKLWVRLFAAVAIGFTIQENAEHLLQHGHGVGLAALHGPEYPLAIPVLGVVTLVAAVLGAAVLGIEHELLAAIAVLARRAVRAPRLALRPPLELLVTHRSPMAHQAAGRAPPTAFASVSVT